MASATHASQAVGATGLCLLAYKEYYVAEMGKIGAKLLRFLQVFRLC